MWIQSYFKWYFVEAKVNYRDFIFYLKSFKFFEIRSGFLFKHFCSTSLCTADVCWPLICAISTFFFTKLNDSCSHTHVYILTFTAFQMNKSTFSALHFDDWAKLFLPINWLDYLFVRFKKLVWNNKKINVKLFGVFLAGQPLVIDW